MKPTKSTLALICLICGLVLYPVGLYLSKAVAHQDRYSSLNPWRVDLFHDLVVPLPAIIPAALLLAGCVLSVQVSIGIARSRGVRDLLRYRTVHLWVGVLLLVYIVATYVVALT
jgi:hypothetical protein